MDGYTAAALSSNQALAMAVIIGLCALVALLSVVAWALVIRTLNKIDKNQTDLHKSISKAHSRVDVLSKEHYRLAGAHDARTEMGGCGTGTFDSAEFGKALGEGFAFGLKQVKEALSG